MSCLALNGKSLCRNGIQRRFSGDHWEEMPCVLCRPDQWAEWASAWKVPIVPKPAQPQTALFEKGRTDYAD